MSELASLFTPAAVPVAIPVAMPVQAVPVAAAVPASPYVFKNFTVLTRTNQVFLTLSIFLTVFSIAASGFAIAFASRVTDVDQYYELMPLGYALTCLGIGLGQLLVGFAGVICFSMWLHRICANVHVFGASDFSFTPGKAAASLFIPFINLFRPYEVVRDVWKASVAPSQWAEEEDPGFVGAWWLFAVAAGVTNQVYWRFARNAETLSHEVRAEIISMVGDLFTIGFFIAGFILVGRVPRKQLQRQDERLQQPIG